MLSFVIMADENGSGIFNYFHKMALSAIIAGPNEYAVRMIKKVGLGDILNPLVNKSL